MKSVVVVVLLLLYVVDAKLTTPLNSLNSLNSLVKGRKSVYVFICRYQLVLNLSYDRRGVGYSECYGYSCSAIGQSCGFDFTNATLTEYLLFLSFLSKSTFSSFSIWFFYCCNGGYCSDYNGGICMVFTQTGQSCNVAQNTCISIFFFFFFFHFFSFSSFSLMCFGNHTLMFVMHLILEPLAKLLHSI